MTRWIGLDIALTDQSCIRADQPTDLNPQPKPRLSRIHICSDGPLRRSDAVFCSFEGAQQHLKLPGSMNLLVLQYRPATATPPVAHQHKPALCPGGLRFLVEY